MDEVVDEVTKDCDVIISERCPKWNLQIETEKTQAVLVPPPNVKPTVNFKIRDKTIEQMPQKKDLGITIDENLDFNTHIQERKSKGSKGN